MGTFTVLEDSPPEEKLLFTAEREREVEQYRMVYSNVADVA